MAFGLRGTCSLLLGCLGLLLLAFLLCSESGFIFLLHPLRLLALLSSGFTLLANDFDLILRRWNGDFRSWFHAGNLRCIFRCRIGWN